MGAETSLDRADAIREKIRERLDAAAPGLLARHPPEEYVRAFDEAAATKGYRHVPEHAGRWVGAIEAAGGAPALEDYHRLVLATLIEERERRPSPIRIPDSIRELLASTHARILSEFDVARHGFYRHENDLFAKDLAVCRGKLLPCGAELVDVASGIPRRLLVQGGAGQLLRGFAYFALGRRRFRPWLQGHWDRRLARDFNKEGYDRCYERVAELLELNPELAGLSGSSWWYDPALESISPKLAFLRRVPLDNGAREFQVGTEEGATRDALQLSRERRAAFDAGRYKPSVWLIAWGRDELCAWARAR